MSMRPWAIDVEVWPHSSGNGQTKDQEAAGERCQTYSVRAGSIDEALTIAKAFQAGLQRGPMVWQAPIVGIRMVKP